MADNSDLVSGLKRGSGQATARFQSAGGSKFHSPCLNIAGRVLNVDNEGRVRIDIEPFLHGPFQSLVHFRIEQARGRVVCKHHARNHEKDDSHQHCNQRFAFH